MGLSFTVGVASFVFLESYAAEVEQALNSHLNIPIPAGQSRNFYFSSEEVNWSGWQELQQKATTLCGEEAMLHFLAVTASKGVYLPALLEPTAIVVGDDPTVLQCASLPVLRQELERFGNAASLPTDSPMLEILWQDAMRALDIGQEDNATETYIQLMFSVKVATDQSLPLWIVK